MNEQNAIVSPDVLTDADFDEDGEVKDQGMTDVAAVLRKANARSFLEGRVVPIAEYGEFRPEEEDPNVLIYGPWLERGGSALWISTAGTGKSIFSVQFSYSMAAGEPICGLRPRTKHRVWILETEDSPRRVAQDRIDTLAELKETRPEADWDTAAANVKVVVLKNLKGRVGAPFIAELDELLQHATDAGEKPDIIILNPLFGFIGGDISDSKFVSPFLRGGYIDGQYTCGLVSVLERHEVALVAFHHTPKPPKESEIDSWMKSPFPEYQGAGSAELTNWFRSCVTMMRVKGHADMVCVTAGKNGAELGWQRVSGAPRHYLAYSTATGVSGKTRHAWRELDEEEAREIVGGELQKAEIETEDVAAKMAEDIRRNGATRVKDVDARFAGSWRRPMIRAAWALITANPAKYHLTEKNVLIGRSWTKFYGLVPSIEALVLQAKQRARIDEAKNQAKDAVLTAPAEPLPPKPADVQNDTQVKTETKGADDGFEALF